MIIKTIINGKEVKGYWNGKTYKSKVNPENNIRIYIDNKEYDIPKNEFKYEELLSEKQINYARILKEDLITFLEKKNVDNDSQKNKIIDYFKEKDEKYFLKNESKLRGIKILFELNTDLLAKLTIEKDKLIDYYNINIIDNSISKKELQKIIISPLTVEILNSIIAILPEGMDIYRINGEYYIEMNNYYVYNQYGDYIPTKDFEENILKDNKLKDVLIATLELKSLKNKKEVEKMKELVFTLNYQDVSIKGLATQDGNGNIEVKYYHPQTGQLQENIEQTLYGWKYQDEELNKQIRELIQLSKKYNDEIFEWIRDYIGDEEKLELEIDEYGVRKKNKNSYKLNP